MYSEEQISQLFGDKSLQYVKNKHKGGSSNEKGNSYENFYATYKIASLAIAAIEQNVHITFYSQILSFVDDFIILYEVENRLQHHQLKNSINVGWGKALKSISDDFRKQEALNRNINKASEMVLVVSDEQLQQKLAKSCPPDIQAYSQVALFPHREDLMQVILAVPAFYEAIRYLCAFESPDLDKIECVAKVLLGAWVGGSKAEVSVFNVLKQAQNFSPSFIRAFDDTLLLDPQVADILGNIAGLKWELTKGFFHWQYANVERGTLPYRIGEPSFDRFEMRIKASRPTDFEEFEVLL